MKIKVVALLVLLLGAMVPSSRACMWDSTTLWTEKRRHPDLAKTILGEPEKAEPAGPLRERIQKLTKERRENEPMWWNDLAVAHMKLGELKEAVELLESVTNRFANDYGVHANLGTAYHLIGRYTEAEREIARDLEINPDAHFGLEKYHLALLQYLIRDDAYKARHVYVDEFTGMFLQGSVYMMGGGFGEPHAEQPLDEADKAELAKLAKNYSDLVKKGASASELGSTLRSMRFYDQPPSYTEKWDLKRDEKLKDGLIYMATLNPKEPACFQMLGVWCMWRGNRNLATAAFHKAIELGSPQTPMLKAYIIRLDEYTWKARIRGPLLFMVPVLLGVAYFIYCRIRKARKMRGQWRCDAKL